MKIKFIRKQKRYVNESLYFFSMNKLNILDV